MVEFVCLANNWLTRQQSLIRQYFFFLKGQIFIGNSRDLCYVWQEGYETVKKLFRIWKVTKAVGHVVE